MTEHEIALMLARYMAATGKLPDELKAMMTREISDLMVFFVSRIVAQDPSV